MFTVAQAWNRTHPGACAGILAMTGVRNPETHAGLEACKEELTRQLRERFSGWDRAALGDLPALRAYGAYYKRFRKNYHVQFQLESVALKGKPIPRVAALVEAMFMAELQSLLLTAGHDLGAIRGAVRLDVADGSERCTLLNGQEQELKAGDMIMADEQGVISSVIHGPDRRTRITPATREVFFAVYAPTGIGEEAVREHLLSIRDHVGVVAPEARVVELQVHTAR
jgi:DNA/RNA-binding domain of Phe-tRNA-synthetase-like protein